ncbi:MAG: SUMF1/EgtB/PvdO family nonheme iron enzyme [Candidatus Cloacimonetes bacterium]|nr:SUMF1/EgtB/PvdO family nonheme iron enzyme [Candidatus Cloacimonadota bacterium]
MNHLKVLIMACSISLAYSNDHQVRKFYDIYSSLNETIDTSAPSPIYPPTYSNLVSEVFVNRFHQKFIGLSNSREIVSRLLFAEAEVTQAQFEAVMSFNPSLVKNLDFPVTNVSFSDVSEYAAKISTSGELYQVFDRDLWLEALLQDNKTRFHFGNDRNLLDEYAWTGTNSENTIHTIRTLRSSSIGLYDMHGNVAEMVTKNNKPEVINCNYFEAFGFCDSSYYYDITKDFKSSKVGFRLVLTKYKDSEVPPDQENAKVITSIPSGTYVSPFLMDISANISLYNFVFTVDGSPPLPKNGVLCSNTKPCKVAITKDRIIRARLCKNSNPYDCPYKESTFTYIIESPLAKPDYQSSVLSQKLNRLDWSQNTIDITLNNIPVASSDYEVKAYLEIQGFANSPYIVDNGVVNLESRNRPFCKYEEIDQFREIETRRAAYLYYTVQPKFYGILSNSSLRKNLYAGLFQKIYIYTKGIGKSQSCILQNIGRTVNYDDETALEVE